MPDPSSGGGRADPGFLFAILRWRPHVNEIPPYIYINGGKASGVTSGRLQSSMAAARARAGSQKVSQKRKPKKQHSGDFGSPKGVQKGISYGLKIASEAQSEKNDFCCYIQHCGGVAPPPSPPEAARFRIETSLKNKYLNKCYFYGKVQQ